MNKIYIAFSTVPFSTLTILHSEYCRIFAIELRLICSAWGCVHVCVLDRTES